MKIYTTYSQIKRFKCRGRQSCRPLSSFLKIQQSINTADFGLLGPGLLILEGWSFQPPNTWNKLLLYSFSLRAILMLTVCGSSLLYVQWLLWFCIQTPHGLQLTGRSSWNHDHLSHTNLADTIEAILLEVLIVERHRAVPDIKGLPGVHPGERVGNFQGSRLSDVAVYPLWVVGGGLTTRTQLFVKGPDFTDLVELNQLCLGGWHLPSVADLESW